MNARQEKKTGRRKKTTGRRYNSLELLKKLLHRLKRNKQHQIKQTQPD